MMQRDATIDRVNRSSGGDVDGGGVGAVDDDGRRRRDNREVLLKVLLNSLFTAVVVGTALHAALSIMPQQMDDTFTSHTYSFHQLFNHLRSAFDAAIQYQRSSDIRPQEWIYTVVAAIVKAIVIDPSNLLLRLIHGAVSNSSHHTHRLHTLGSIYSDCLQWMQWDVSSALAVAWILSPIVIWLHHIQSMTLIDISSHEIISIVQTIMRRSPSIPLLSNPISHHHHHDGSSSQRREQPGRHSSAADDPTAAATIATAADDDASIGSITASPDTASGIVIKGIGAFIDGRPALKVLTTSHMQMHS